jgi:hypothetical protein
MYTDADYERVKASLRKFIALYLAAAAVLIGLLVLSLFARIEWLAYTAAALLPLALVFLWGYFGVRLDARRRFLRDMLAGLEKQVTGTIASIEEEEAQKEGLEFRAMRLMTGEDSDKAGGRLLYVESSMFPLPAGPGQKVSCKTFGSYVKDIWIMEGE